MLFKIYHCFLKNEDNLIQLEKMWFYYQDLVTQLILLIFTWVKQYVSMISFYVIKGNHTINIAFYCTSMFNGYLVKKWRKCLNFNLLHKSKLSFTCSTRRLWDFFKFRFLFCFTFFQKFNFLDCKLSKMYAMLN